MGRSRLSPVNIVWAAIVLQAVLGLVLGLPGHLSSDSIVQLYEARTLQFISFQPPIMSLLLRVLDGWVQGTSLFVVLDQALITASFTLLFLERTAELRLPAAIVAALVALNPLLLAYTGIVWKDVLMSHLAALGYVCLYVAGRWRPSRGRIAWALSSALALALAASLRQHALLLAIPGAVYAAFLVANGRATRWAFALTLSATVIGINIAIIAYADAVAVGEKIPRTATGLRSLAVFDLAGIAANGGSIPDAPIAAELNTALVPFYTPLRNDPLPAPVQGSPLSRTETRDLLDLWGRSIMASPVAYLSHRFANFWALLWQSGTARPCAATLAGVVSTVYVPSLGRDIMPELGLQRRLNLRDLVLAGIEYLLRRTPLFNHVFWAVALAAVGLRLWRRGGAGALVVFAASALAFTLTFGVVGISCEFRYIYVLPVAATLLLFVLIIAPKEEGASGGPGSTLSAR